VDQENPRKPPADGPQERRSKLLRGPLGSKKKRKRSVKESKREMRICEPKS